MLAAKSLAQVLAAKPLPQGRLADFRRQAFQEVLSQESGRFGRCAAARPTCASWNQLVALVWSSRTPMLACLCNAHLFVQSLKVRRAVWCNEGVAPTVWCNESVAPTVRVCDTRAFRYLGTPTQCSPTCTEFREESCRLALGILVSTSRIYILNLPLVSTS